MTTMSAFFETKNIFAQYTSFETSLAFDEWNSRPHDQKAALLFVQFFASIVAAWEKANSFDFIPGDDGVSVVCQYLEKNVSKIEENPSRFTASYIYRVAYNCMYCICHDLKSVKDRWENETSNIVAHDGSELDLFDTVAASDSAADDVYFMEEFRSKFWAVVEQSGLEAQKVIDYLLSGDPSSLKKVNKNSKSYANDILRDVEVSLDKVEDILAQLRKNLQAAGLDPQVAFAAEM